MKPDEVVETPQSCSSDISPQLLFPLQTNRSWMQSPFAHRNPPAPHIAATINTYAQCVIICPIAIAYSYGTDNKIGLRMSVCLSVCLSVRVSSLSWSHFFVDFHQIWHRGVNPKSKNEFVGVNIAPPLPLFLSLIHIWRCRRIERCRSRWSPYH